MASGRLEPVRIARSRRDMDRRLEQCGPVRAVSRPLARPTTADPSDNKVAEYQSLSVHLTTHRLILLPDPAYFPPSKSSHAPNLQVQLRYVRQTEFYNGFMRSSPKITLSLGPSPTAPLPDQQSANVETSWTCGVCGYVNGIQGVDGVKGSKCGLCGVGYMTARSISTPVTRTGSPAPMVPVSRASTDDTRPPNVVASETAPVATAASREIACPACTFLNHPSLTTCEICSTPLPKRQTPRPERQQSAPSPDTPSSGGASATSEVTRLSFRDGKTTSSEAYRRLKNVLSDKAWERVRRFACSCSGAER